MVQFSIPQLERLAMRHGLLRGGISQLLKVAGDKPKRQKFKRYLKRCSEDDLYCKFAERGASVISTPPRLWPLRTSCASSCL